MLGIACRLNEEKHLVSNSLQKALKEKDRLNERLKTLEEKSTSGEQSHINAIREVFVEVLSVSRQNH